MSRFISAVLLTGALCLPLTMNAQDKDQRYYDKQHKDYHQWNADEDRQYHEFLKERHERDHDWSKASASERQAFWNWQHNHEHH